ncbi:MAG: phage holin family protein [Alphaproteobacteria bacterium]
MSETTAREGAAGRGDSRSVPDLLRRLVDETAMLVRTEMRMARTETADNLERAQGGVMRLAAGAVLALAALIVLLDALVIALGNVMPPTFAALLVGAVVAIIGFALIRSGHKDVSPSSLAPSRTQASVRAAAQPQGEPR